MSLISRFLSNQSSEATTGYGLSAACVAVAILILAALLNFGWKVSPSILTRPHMDRASDTWNGWPSARGEPDRSPEHPSDRPPPEHGMISPWFGLAPSMGRHERSFDQMKRDIFHPFRGTHTRRTEAWENPKLQRGSNRFPADERQRLFGFNRKEIT
jgi:hypothetical protein